ncbi:MAG TPA: glycosyltransferase [Candidatus Acidoferrales bacterium]|nr:glycosyltransferase [Candidatus Acidoferrales bacterium]
MSSAERDPAHAGLDVLILVSSDPRYDSRSSKYLHSLLDAGFDARLVGISSDGEEEIGETLVRLPMAHVSGKKFFLQFYQRAIPEMRRSRAKIIIAGDLFSLLPAVANKRRYSSKSTLPTKNGSSVKLIYDSKELYEHLPSLKTKRSSFMFWNLVEKISIKYVDHVLTVNKSIADILETKWRKPTTVIMNVPDVKRAPAFGERSLNKVTLAFSGGFQGGRGLCNLIRLLTLLPERYELKLIGDGKLRGELEEFTAALNLSGRVHFIGKLRNSEVIDELSKATLGIYLMENSGLCHYLALPNKLFQFISAGLPVIVPNFPEMAGIVSKFQIGEIVDPENLSDTAEKILEMTSHEEHYQDLVGNCNRAAGVLNWQVEKEKFLALINSLI